MGYRDNAVVLLLWLTIFNPRRAYNLLVISVMCMIIIMTARIFRGSSMITNITRIVDS